LDEMLSLEEPRRRPEGSVVSPAIGRARCVSHAVLDASLAAASPAQRQARLARLSASVGNRNVALLVADRRGISRAPATPPTGPSAPAFKIPAAAVARLEGMGIEAAQVAALERGELVLYDIKVAGQSSTYALLQLRQGLLRGGIFSIAVKGDADAAVKAFFRFRQPILELGRDMGLPEIELFGAAIHNAKISALLRRQGFVETTEVIPESLGFGPATEIQVVSKRFPVPGSKVPVGGGTPPTGGVTPPVGGGGAPPSGGSPPVRGAGSDPVAPTRTPSAVAPESPPKAPSVSGAGVEPAVGKVGPPATGELPPMGELPVFRPRFTIGSVVGLAGNVLASLALWWLSAKLAEWQERFIAARFADKVDPHVREAMVKLAPAAEKLTAEDPSQPVYTNITVEFKYGGWRGSVGGSEAIYDVDFVGPVNVSRTKVATERTVRESSDCTSGGGYGCAYSGVRRVTYSVEVKFDETEDQHFWSQVPGGGVPA
jgi:hypothetical protein